MEKVKGKLEKITNAWNYYFLKNRFCQSHINFTEEVRTNYYGDILSYFNDTLMLLEDTKPEMEFGKSIFQAFGLLQIIYTHQDLIDELLYIFKLPQSTKEDKETNRRLRNELVGHPIRRLPGNNELISSVFFGRDFKQGTIHYVLYSKEDQFSGKDVKCSVLDLILDHKNYLEKYLNQIWNKVLIILNRFKKRLAEIELLANKNLQFGNLLNLVSYYFESIFKENYLFEKELLLVCFNKRNEHPRYAFAINLFLDTLKDYIRETINNINVYIFNEDTVSSLVIAEAIAVGAGEEKSQNWIKYPHLSYELSKLFERNHPLFNVASFQRQFPHDVELLDELANMEKHVRNDLEYYSSYEYLTYLLQTKGYLRDLHI